MSTPSSIGDGITKLDRPLDGATAIEYASWFKALADGTRVLIVSLLAGPDSR